MLHRSDSFAPCSYLLPKRYKNPFDFNVLQRAYKTIERYQLVKYVPKK